MKPTSFGSKFKFDHDRAVASEYEQTHSSLSLKRTPGYFYSPLQPYSGRFLLQNPTNLEGELRVSRVSSWKETS